MSTQLETPAANTEPMRETFERCYYLGDYERNGYDDSDFHVVFWDDRIGEIRNVMFGSTRFAGGWNYSSDLLREIPDDVAERIRARICASRLASLTKEEIARVNEPTPQQMPFGTRVRITKASRKGSKYTFAAGDVGEVSGHYWFGTFYSKGYNSKGRHNGRAGVRLNDGRTVFVAMTMLRLDCEPDLARVAREAAAAKLRCPHAWWTHRNGTFAE